MEDRLRQIWSQVFDLDSAAIGPDSHFFRLGGDSIMAIKVKAEACRNAISLTTKNIFDRPILADVVMVAKEINTQSETVKEFELLPQDKLETIRIAAAAQCKISESELEEIFPALGCSCYFMLTCETVPTGWMHCNAFPLAPQVELDRYMDCWKAAISSHQNLRSRIIIMPEVGIYQVVVRTADTFREAGDFDALVADEKEIQDTLGRATKPPLHRQERRRPAFLRLDHQPRHLRQLYRSPPSLRTHHPPPPPPSPASSLPSSSPPLKSTTILRRKDILPPVREMHLGPSQNSVNLNVSLPGRGRKMTVMLRRDTTACTHEIVDAFVRGVEVVAGQLVNAGKEVRVRELNEPDTTGVNATIYDE